MSQPTLSGLFIAKNSLQDAKEERNKDSNCPGKHLKYTAMETALRKPAAPNATDTDAKAGARFTKERSQLYVLTC